MVNIIFMDDSRTSATGEEKGEKGQKVQKRADVHMEAGDIGIWDILEPFKQEYEIAAQGDKHVKYLE